MTVSDIKLKLVAIKSEDLVEQKFFAQGIHKVRIIKADFENLENGSIFLNVKLAGENGEEGDARLFFTEKATRVSIDTLRKILVHSQEDDERKEAVREAFQKITSLLDLKPLVRSIVGKEAWYKVEKSDQTYIDKNGETKYSYSRNLYGFEPKFKENKTYVEEDLKAKVEDAMGVVPEEQIDLSEIPF